MKTFLTLAFLLLSSQQLLAQNKWIEAPSIVQPPQISAGDNGEWVVHSGQHRITDNARITAGTQQGEESFGVICEYDAKKSEKLIVFALGYFGFLTP